MFKLLLFVVLTVAQINGHNLRFKFLRSRDLVCKDCYTIADLEGREFKCRDDDPKTPFCSDLTDGNGANCVPENVCPAKLECKYKGIFPSTLHCNKYHLCESNNGVAAVRVCPEKSNYDSSKKMCTSSMVTCPNFSPIDPKSLCYNKSGDVAYPNHPSLYVNCPKIALGELLSCNSPDMKINIKLVRSKCEYLCTKEGFFASPNDKRKYMVCVKDGTSFKATEEACEQGTFSQDQGCCIKNDEDPSRPTTISGTELI